MIRIVAVVLLIVVLIAGGYFLLNKGTIPVPTNPFQPDNRQTETQTTDSQVIPERQVANALVTITKDGFTPSTIKVKVGNQVMFTNSDKSGHWIASDPHPTHTLLPGFDSEQSLGEGESF